MTRTSFFNTVLPFCCLLVLNLSMFACGDAEDDNAMSNDGETGAILGGTGNGSGQSSNGTVTDNDTQTTPTETTPTETTPTETTPDEEERVGPTYTQGECPDLIQGRNSDFASAGLSRSFLLELPPEPNGAPVIFAWHWLGGDANRLVSALGLANLAKTEGVIVIAPESKDSQFEWRFTASPTNNADLTLFDDLLACLWDQYDVDLNRIHSTGHSAGGLWTSYLTMHRSEWLASTAPMSGGADSRSYQTPQAAIPVLMIWGGEDDVFQGGLFDFNVASQYLSQNLISDGHFVVNCVHDRGHVPPPGATALVWSWFEAHPANIDDEPFKDGLPDTFPSFCSIP